MQRSRKMQRRSSVRAPTIRKSAAIEENDRQPHEQVPPSSGRAHIDPLPDAHTLFSPRWGQAPERKRQHHAQVQTDHAHPSVTGATCLRAVRVCMPGRRLRASATVFEVARIAPRVARTPRTMKSGEKRQQVCQCKGGEMRARASKGLTQMRSLFVPARDGWIPRI